MHGFGTDLLRAALVAALTGGTALAQDAPRPAVVVAPAEVADLRFGVTYTGRVVAAQKVELRARVSGFLEEIHFTEGQTVGAGDVLFSIQDEAYAAAVREAEGTVRAAEAERDLARLERDRKATLVQRQAVAQNELDVAAAQLDRIEGQLQQLNAALDRQKLELSYTQVVAPFDGHVGLKGFDVGALVGPESGPLVTLTRLDTVEVEARVETARLLDFRAAEAAGLVRTGPTVRLTLPNGVVYPLMGTLDYISADVTQGTDTVTVRARFDNPDGTLLDGALVRVALEQGDPEMVLVVPQSAVQRDQLGTFVMVVGADGKVEQRRVTVARSAQGRSVIDNGLAEGEQVIVEGLNKVAARSGRRRGARRRMISDVFISRPRLAAVISIVLTLAGLIALTALPIAQYPDIVPPQVSVTASYPGAGADVVETTVAQPIEGRVVGVDDMLYMKSTSGSDGSYTLNVTFAVGTDPDIATVNVQNRVSLATPGLPQEVSQTGVSVKKQSSGLLQVVAITGEGGEFDGLLLSNYATINVLDALKRVPGVGDATLFGALDYAMRIDLDVDRLTSLGLSPPTSSRP